jgi:hypothetical protein
MPSLLLLDPADKPHMGTLNDWERRAWEDKFYFTGVFDGHPIFHGHRGHTSYLVKQDGVQIETRNSRYTLGRKREDDA